MDMNYIKDGKCDVEVCHAKCCGDILPVSQKEIQIIKKFIEDQNIQPINYNAGQNIFDKEFHNVCPFLNEKYSCNIYEVRPEVCRFYSCAGSEKEFGHWDKHIISMLKTFFPEEKCLYMPDVEAKDKYYQTQIDKVRPFYIKQQRKEKK